VAQVARLAGPNRILLQEAPHRANLHDRCGRVLYFTLGFRPPTWKLSARGILLESKDGSSGFGNLRQRLGRSPGKGDAVVMAWSEGNKEAMARAQKKAAPQRSPSYSSHPQAWMG